MLPPNLCWILVGAVSEHALPAHIAGAGGGKCDLFPRGHDNEDVKETKGLNEEMMRHFQSGEVVFW